MVAGTAGLAILKRVVWRVPGGGCLHRVLGELHKPLESGLPQQQQSPWRSQQQQAPA